MANDSPSPGLSRHSRQATAEGEGRGEVEPRRIPSHAPALIIRENWQSAINGLPSAASCGVMAGTKMNNGSAVERYVPLVCWSAALLTALLICLKIIGYGFLPGGDAAFLQLDIGHGGGGASLARILKHAKPPAGRATRRTGGRMGAAAIGSTRTSAAACVVCNSSSWSSSCSSWMDTFSLFAPNTMRRSLSMTTSGVRSAEHANAVFRVVRRALPDRRNMLHDVACAAQRSAKTRLRDQVD